MKETCQDCTFTVHHIQDVQLTCCSNELETLALRATISSSEDVTLDAILTTIKQWVASKPTLPGGDSVLKVSTVTPSDKNDIVYAKCTSSDSEPQQDEQDAEEDSNQIANNDTIFILLVAVIAVALVAIIGAVITGIVVLGCLKRRKRSRTQER